MKHLAIIMDGNRRWEKDRDLNKYEGYKAGARVINDVISQVMAMGIPYLTVYAFSYENWLRPIKDIAAIMNIGLDWLIGHRRFLMENNIRCRIIGNRELLPYFFLSAVEEIEEETKKNTVLSFQIALSYGSRDEILRACVKFSRSLEKNAGITEANFEKMLDTYDIPDPDLLIRTGGQKRLSNYMLWQLAYTELCFIDKLWPDFSEQDLRQAIVAFEATERRFGRL